MRELIFKKKFSKDVERMKRSGRDMNRLGEVLDLLADGKPLSPNNRDHPLIGNLKGYRECHLGGDWLLIYQLTSEEAILVRTGSHTELFD